MSGSTRACSATRPSLGWRGAGGVWGALVIFGLPGMAPARPLAQGSGSPLVFLGRAGWVSLRCSLVIQPLFFAPVTPGLRATVPGWHVACGLAEVAYAVFPRSGPAGPELRSPLGVLGSPLVFPSHSAGPARRACALPAAPARSRRSARARRLSCAAPLGSET